MPHPHPVWSTLVNPKISIPVPHPQTVSLYPHPTPLLKFCGIIFSTENMEKTDEAALRWAIKKYWNRKTDAEIAQGLNTTEKKVWLMRKEMDIKGTESMKDFARRYLLEMSEADKLEFMKSLSAELIWKMSEGNPASTGELSISTEPIKIDITHQLLKVYGPRAIEYLEHKEIQKGGGK